MKIKQKKKIKIGVKLYIKEKISFSILCVISVMFVCSRLKEYLIPSNMIYVLTSNFRPAKVSVGRQYILWVTMLVPKPDFF